MIDSGDNAENSYERWTDMSTTTGGTIGVTGATGHLGPLVIEGLIRNGVPTDRIVAVVRNPEKAAALTEQGVDVRVADYGDEGALENALTGVNTLLLISGSEIGARLPQHRNVLTAAEAAGVGRLVYTSVLKADTSTLELAAEHLATEELLNASPLTSTILRNGWYWENYLSAAQTAAQTGVLLGAAGTGRVAGAARADYADAAVAVLTGSGHEDKTYELGGDEHLTYADLAEAIEQARGGQVQYSNLPEEQYAAELRRAGIPDAVASFLAKTDTATARGDLDTTSTDLHRLTDRPSTPAVKVLAG